MIDLVQHLTKAGSSVKLAAQIEALVREGRIPPESLLPPVRTVAKALNVSPGTAAAAYKALRAQGVVTSDRRRGRRRPAPNGHHHGGPGGDSRGDHRAERPRGRPAPVRESHGDRQPHHRERPAPAEPRRAAAEPAVMVFPRPPQEPRRRPQPEQHPERRVVGFGDDLPAFLARAPRAVAGV